MRFTDWVLGSTLLAAACAPKVDDPSNPPRLGHWSKDWRVTGVSINDVGMNRSELPFDLPNDTQEDMGCVEPGMRDTADLNRALGQRTGGQCVATTVSVAGTTLSGEGKCDFTGKAQNVSGRFTLTGTQGADRIRAVQTTHVFAQGEAGGTDQAKLVSVLEWTRLGDCR